MKKFALMLFTVLCALLMLGGCGSEKTEESAEEKVFRVGIGGSKETYTMELTASVAIKENYLEEELSKIGYQLEVVYFSGFGPEIASAMASKDIEVGFMGEMPLINSAVAGVPLTVEAILMDNMPMCVVVNDESIQETKDLEGKKIAMVSGSVAEYYWKQLIEKHGIDQSKIEMIYDATGSSYLSGQADAMIMATFSAQMYTDKKIGRIVENSINTEEYNSSVYAVARTEVLEEDPEVASAIHKAMERAYEACSEDHDLLYRDCASDQVTEEVWRDGIEGVVDFETFNPRIGQKEIEDLDRLADWMYENGYITEKIEAETLFDLNYME